MLRHYYGQYYYAIYHAIRAITPRHAAMPFATLPRRFAANSVSQVSGIITTNAGHIYQRNTSVIYA